MTPPPRATLPPPPPMEAPEAYRAPSQRPGGVTYACILSIVLGAFGCLGGLVLLAVSGFYSLIPVVGSIFATFGLFLAVMVAGVGVLGIVAGVQGMNGQSWARWTLVVLLALGALTAITTLVVPALNITAIVMLVNADANAWFASQQPRHLAVR